IDGQRISTTLRRPTADRKTHPRQPAGMVTLATTTPIPSPTIPPPTPPEPMIPIYGCSTNPKPPRSAAFRDVSLGAYWGPFGNHTSRPVMNDLRVWARLARPANRPHTLRRPPRRVDGPVDSARCVHCHNLRAVHRSVDAAQRLVDELQPATGALVRAQWDFVPDDFDALLSRAWRVPESSVHVDRPSPCAAGIIGRLNTSSSVEWDGDV
ncbi:MAG: hypothetical protein JWR32_4066, partial [Mycobacterium sp.]|nr:hypothetical protein [Mycobacterium sp.]